MFPYFCIVNTPGRAGHEICVVAGNDDGQARSNLADIARLWPGFETIELYQGERVVIVFANVDLGFADTPLTTMVGSPFANAA